MNAQAAKQYLQSRVLTATPEQLQLMLFDGALRFADQAKIGLEKKDYELSYNMIGKVQKILTELSCSLKREINPELCDKLASLYSFAYRKLTEANIEHKIESLDAAVNVLKYQRETWVMLMDQLSKSKAATVAKKLDMPSPSSRMEASISMQG